MADDTEYNLNDPWKEEHLKIFCESYQSNTLEEIQVLSEKDSEQSKLDLSNTIWKNFCISYAYEPGFTAKALMVAKGLETDKVQEKL